LGKDEACPVGHYFESVSPKESGSLKALAGKAVCKKCHPKCKKCTSYGFHTQVSDVFSLLTECFLFICLGEYIDNIYIFRFVKNAGIIEKVNSVKMNALLTFMLMMNNENASHVLTSVEDAQVLGLKTVNLVEITEFIRLVIV
jgi:hypothetical protein